MADIGPIEDSYIDGIIKSNSSDPASDKTLGSGLRELMKRLRDRSEQELAKVHGAALYGPYPDLMTALGTVTSRYEGLTVGIETTEGVVEYWWQNGLLDENLVVKYGSVQSGNLQLSDLGDVSTDVNTATDGQLLKYNGQTGQWENWTPDFENLTNYYNKQAIDSFFSGTAAVTGYNKSDWDTAYGWGNHAQAGYAADDNVVHKTGNETKIGDLTLINQLTVNERISFGELSFSGYNMTGAGFEEPFKITNLFNDSYISLGDLITIGKSEAGGVTLHHPIGDYFEAHFPEKSGTLAMVSDIPDVSGFANTADVVHKFGSETIQGIKTFTPNDSPEAKNIIINGGGLTVTYPIQGDQSVNISEDGINFSPGDGLTGTRLVRGNPIDFINVTLPSISGTLALISDMPDISVKENKSEKNQANGYAGLDANGLIVSSLLPSYVDDVLEFPDFASLPASGETGKIYITTDNNKCYRWGGSVYIEIVASPGSTDSVPEGSLNLYYTDARVKAYADTLYLPVSGTAFSSKRWTSDQNTAFTFSESEYTAGLDYLVGKATGYNAFVNISKQNVKDYLGLQSAAYQQADQNLRIADSPTFRALRLDINNANDYREIIFRTGGANRWNAFVQGSEPGNNEGSNFYIARYNDSGDYIDIPLIINRNDGVVSFNIRPRVNGDTMALSADIPDVSGKANLSGGNSFIGNQVVDGQVEVSESFESGRVELKGGMRVWDWVSTDRYGWYNASQMEWGDGLEGVSLNWSPGAGTYHNLWLPHKNGTLATIDDLPTVNPGGETLQSVTDRSAITNNLVYITGNDAPVTPSSGRSLNLRQVPDAYGVIDCYNHSGSVGVGLSINPSGGNVGIGTTLPEYRLDVNGAGRFKADLKSENTLSFGVHSLDNMPPPLGSYHRFSVVYDPLRNPNIHSGFLPTTFGLTDVGLSVGTLANTAAGEPRLMFFKARGTDLYNPQNVLAGDVIGRPMWYSYFNGGYRLSSLIQSYVVGTSNGDFPTAGMIFNVRKPGNQGEYSTNTFIELNPTEGIKLYEPVIASGNFTINGVAKAATFQTDGQAAFNLDYAGNNDFYLRGGGVFRIVNDTNTVELFTVSNAGNSSLAGYMNVGGRLISSSGIALDGTNTDNWVVKKNGSVIEFWLDGVLSMKLDSTGLKLKAGMQFYPDNF